MKLRFNREAVSDALGAICNVASSRTTKDILKCVRLEAKRDVLLMHATDLEMSLRCAVSEIDVDNPGQAVVLADTFARIVRECPDETLSIESDPTMLHVRGSGAHFKIVTQDPSEFPPAPAMDGEPDYTIEAGMLQRMIEWTSMAAARESTRYAINGVLWEIGDGKLTLAATDGRRLAVAKGEAGGSRSGGKGMTAIVPTKAASVFTRLSVEPDARVAVKVSSNQLVISVGGAMIGTALVEGHFPKYQDVIPTDCNRIATLNTGEFLAALKQAALLTNEESKGIRLTFAEGSLTISSRAPEQGEATITMPVVYKEDPMEIGFNPVFLMEVLRVSHSEEVTLALREANRPGLLHCGEDFLYVVMPVSLSGA